jgi:hypothetical protein
VELKKNPDAGSLPPGFQTERPIPKSPVELRDPLWFTLLKAGSEAPDMIGALQGLVSLCIHLPSSMDPRVSVAQGEWVLGGR